MSKFYSLAELAKILSAEIKGDPECQITGVSTLVAAQKGHVTFLDNVRYRKYLATTQASAVILSPANLEDCPTNALMLANPYLGYAKVASLFAAEKNYQAGIHSTAILGVRTKIHPSVHIGPYCVIGDDVVIDEKVIIEANSVIGDRCHIGAKSHLMPRVVLYKDIQIGKRALFHSGAVIGSDGFGFAQDAGRWHKVPQLGSVIIGDDVEIGSNTSIDRGALENTHIHSGVKIDNLVQIAHNVVIGEHTAIAGCVGIAGSTTIGKHCAIGGGVGISGHISITDGVIITGGSLVAQSIEESGVYTSGIAAIPTRAWKKNLVRIYQLDDMMRRIKELEKKLIETPTESEELI